MGESRPFKVYQGTAKGKNSSLRIVMPAEMARQVDIEPGDYITWEIAGRGELIVRKARGAIVPQQQKAIA